MSTVAIEYREATCPKCGALASEHLERYLRPGEYPFFGICYCEVPLVYETVHCYQAVCDGCGQHVTDYGDWSAIGNTPEDMWEFLPDWEHPGGRDLCEKCCSTNENDESHEAEKETT